MEECFFLTYFLIGEPEALFDIRYWIQAHGLAVTFANTTRKFEGFNSYEFYFSNKIAYIPIPTVSRMGKSQPSRGREQVLPFLAALTSCQVRPRVIVTHKD